MYSTADHLLLQTKKVRHSVFIGLLLCALSLCAQAEDGDKSADVRLVIDVSGSMKKNDPNDLRQPSVDLLVRLLPDGSKAGVWTFGKYVNMLIPHKEVDQPWREMAREKAKEINSVALFTNMGDALEKAAHDRSRPSKTHNTSIILLTDGMVDISKSPEDNQKEWRRIVDSVIPELKNAGFTIHTVALSENADTHLLEKIAVSTGGTSAVAYTADDLMKIFLKAFDVAAPAQQVPLEDNAFVVDSSVEEFTALIFRVDGKEQTQIVGPDEQAYSDSSNNEDVSWLRTDRFDLITVKRPLEGEWVVKANIDPDSRITVVSDMRLRVKTLPNNSFSGAQESLSFVLQEEGKTITRPDFLSLLTNSVSLTYGPKDTPTHQIWDHVFNTETLPKSGVYNVALPELKKLGVYEVAVVVDGKTFKRTFNHTITVREPFAASIEQGLDDNGVEQYTLTVKSYSDNIEIKKTQVAATVINPKRRKVVKPLGFTEFDHWQTILHPDLKGGYTIQVRITGKDANDEAFEYLLDPLNINHDPDSAFVEPEVEPIKEEPEPVKEVGEKVEPKLEVEETPIQPVEVVVPEQVSVNESEASGSMLKKVLLYAGLALGNLLVLGGGYFLFKKLTSSSVDNILDDLDDADEAPMKEPPLEAFEESEAPIAAMDDSQALAMDDGDSTYDELPPMEDIDVAFDPDEEVADDEEMDMAKAMEMEADALGEPPVINDALDEDDLGIDDELEEAHSADQEPDQEPDEDDSDDVDKLEDEMRKAQGLDLADDELDDAINNLIDELDDSRDVSADEELDDLDDLDGIDFGEEDDSKS